MLISVKCTYIQRCIHKYTHTYMTNSHTYKQLYIPISSICCFISDRDKDFGFKEEVSRVLVSTSWTSNFLLDLLNIILYVTPIIMMKYPKRIIIIRLMYILILKFLPKGPLKLDKLCRR